MKDRRKKDRPLKLLRRMIRDKTLARGGDYGDCLEDRLILSGVISNTAANFVHDNLERVVWRQPMGQVWNNVFPTLKEQLGWHID